MPPLVWSPAALLSVVDHLRRGFGHLNLSAHLLQARSKPFNLLLLLPELGPEILLLLRDDPFQFFYFAMLFEEFV